MNNEILEMLKELKEGQTRLEDKIDDNTKDIKEIKADIKSFKDQFTDYEGKSSANHVEVINKINDIQKDLNKVELVTASNWVEVTKLKSVK